LGVTKEEILISIITPLYNAEKYISETIISVINQTYQNWEMIIVDDCSTDNSREIVKDYGQKDNRIRLVELDNNFGGPAKPRNIGLDNSKGVYVAFLDADDVWLTNKLKEQLFILESNNCDIVHSLAYTIDTKSNNIGFFNNQRIYNKLNYFCSDKTISYFSNFININTVLMKKDLNIRFKEEKYLVALEDWYFWIEHIYSNKKVYLIKEKLINYRVDINSISNRTTDNGYRKIFYMYGLLLNEKKISLTKYILSSIFNTIKIIIKNI
jgi:teichuronic acid biosynthesis glycosyltransferase TuaG